MQPSAQCFAELFPFHIAFDEALQITALGASLVKVLGQDSLGKAFLNVFSIHRPSNLDSLAAIDANQGRVMFLHLNGLDGFKLRGQIVMTGDGKGRLFVGSPVATKLEKLESLGLNLRDFAAFDPMYDFLFMQRANQMAFDDTRRLAAQLRERSNQLNLIFSLSPDGFVLFAATGEISYANPAAYQLLGLDQPTLWQFSREEFEYWLSQRCAAQSAATHDVGPAGNLLIETTPARILHAEDRTALDGAHVYYFRDVTRETEIDRLKSEFLTTAAHELRTPMASIYGYVELMLARRYSPERQADMLATVHRQSKLMITLIDELLDLARIDSGQAQALELTTLDVLPLLQNVIAQASSGQERAFRLSWDGDIPYIRVDAKKISMAIGNVLSNAVKYSDEGSAISVRPRVVERDGNAQLEIAISDQGIGMTPEQLARAFERFYRADPSGHIPGTGLGLCLVREVMRQHAGEVEIESTIGVGTTVRLCLPIEAALVLDQAA